LDGGRIPKIIHIDMDPFYASVGQLFHTLRREEFCKLRVKDFRHTRKGVPHLNVLGKGDKRRYLPLHPGTHALIHEYLAAAGHGEDDIGALFRPIRNNTSGALERQNIISFIRLRCTRKIEL
jgi:site-specific recombinase XerD